MVGKQLDAADPLLVAIQLVLRVLAGPAEKLTHLRAIATMPAGLDAQVSHLPAGRVVPSPLPICCTVTAAQHPPAGG